MNANSLPPQGNGDCKGWAKGEPYIWGVERRKRQEREEAQCLGSVTQECFKDA